MLQRLHIAFYWSVYSPRSAFSSSFVYKPRLRPLKSRPYKAFSHPGFNRHGRSRRPHLAADRLTEKQSLRVCPHCRILEFSLPKKLIWCCKTASYNFFTNNVFLEEICTLVIAEVFPEDSGTFTCTASNTFGTVSSTAALRVKGNVF